jgi:hypothetical protein
VPLRQRAFIEGAIAEVRDAEDPTLPLPMTGGAERPWTAAWERREALDPLVRRGAELLIAFEHPFLEEEERLEREGRTLATDMPAFDDVAPSLGTDPSCPVCHVGVTRLMVQALRRARASDAPSSIGPA